MISYGNVTWCALARNATLSQLQNPKGEKLPQDIKNAQQKDDPYLVDNNSKIIHFNVTQRIEIGQNW